MNNNYINDLKTDDGRISITKMVEDFIKKNGDKISLDILKNPAFSEIIYKAIKDIVSDNGNYKKEQPLISFSLSSSGKSIVLTSNGRDCPNWDVDKVPSIRCAQAKIFIDDENVLNYDYSEGTIYDKKALKDASGNIDMDVKDEAPIYLCTSYSHSMFLNNGIEVSNSTYSDSCDLIGNINSLRNMYRNSDENLLDIVYSNTVSSLHHPDFRFNSVVPPRVVSKGFITSAHRFIDDLSVIESYSSKYESFGNWKTSGGEYIAHTEYPEKIGWLAPVPKTENRDEQYRIREKIAYDFLEGVKNSRTSVDRNKSVTYDALVEQAVKGIQRFDSSFTMENESSKSR